MLLCKEIVTITATVKFSVTIAVTGRIAFTHAVVVYT